MISDLKMAIDRLPLESQISSADKGRISKGATQSLLARIALFEGTWQKNRGNQLQAQEMLVVAADYAKQVIDSKEYILANRYDDLRRWKTAETEMSQALLGARITGTVYGKTYTFPDKSIYTPPATEGKLSPDGHYIVEPAGNRVFQQKHYLRPIPSAEIRITRFKQNPGWE